MNRKLFVVAVFLFYASAGIAEDNSAESPACGGFDSTGLTEGKPIVRVEPVVGTELREDAVESCIVVAYGLKEKRGADGAVLLAYKPKAVAQSDDATEKEEKAVERAIAKWLFLARTHDASKDPVYYSVIVY